MPNTNFPGPKYNDVIANDPQIIAVPLQNMDFGARKSGMPGSVKNDLKVDHVGGSKGMKGR